jgi:hypothetical protein
MNARMSAVSSMILIGRLPATSSQKTQFSKSTIQQIDVEQQVVSPAAAQDVRVGAAAARHPAVCRGLAREHLAHSRYIGSHLSFSKSG